MKIQRNTIRASLLALALLALLPAFGQNNAVRLASSQSIVTDPDHLIGSLGAVAGYFHRNGKLDFLYGGQDYSRSTPSDYYYLATNNGNGTFTTTAATPCDYVPNFSTDLDGDGIGDIWCSNSSTVQYGDGNGGFSVPYGYPPGSFPDALDAVAADFDGDGRPDIAVITVARQLQIFLNQGGRVFTSVHTYPLPSFTVPAPAVKLLAEDLNGDHNTTWSSSTAVRTPASRPSSPRPAVLSPREQPPPSAPSFPLSSAPPAATSTMTATAISPSSLAPASSSCSERQRAPSFRPRDRQPRRGLLRRLLGHNQGTLLPGAR